MTLIEKKESLEHILETNSIFDDLLTLDPEVVSKRKEENSWSIQEHIVHCMDVDIANFTRYRVGIVSPETEIIAMDETWTDKLNYKTISHVEAISVSKMVRQMTYNHLKTVVEDDWTKYSFLYKKYGILNFETFIPVISRHPIAHREFIDNILELLKD